MSYQILGRAVKSEYLSIGTLLSVASIAVLASSGSKEKKPTGSRSIDSIKESVPINASSNEEVQFIKKFVEEAEKEAKH